MDWGDATFKLYDQEGQYIRTIGGKGQGRVPGMDGREGLKTSVFLDVEGAGHYLPKYAGNLDIMTSAAVAVAERVARREIGGRG